MMGRETSNVCCPWTGYPASSSPTSGVLCPRGFCSGKGDQRLVAGRLRGGSGSGSRRDRTRQRFLQAPRPPRLHPADANLRPGCGPSRLGRVRGARGQRVRAERRRLLRGHQAGRNGDDARGYEAYKTMEIVSYYDRLGETLELAAPEGVEDPDVVVVTRGGGDPAYFEDRRIAQACGISVMTLADCVVSEGIVYARVSGRRIDLIYRRFDEDYIDTDLPELERAYLESNVSLVNTPGVAYADDKAVFPYVSAMIEHYLAEALILQNAPTYALTEEQTRTEVLDRLPEVVVKPREGYGAQGILVGPEALPDDIDATHRNINIDPTQFIAQETLDFSTHVLRDAGEASAEVFVDLRAFVLPAIGYLMPGGLTLVAQPGTCVVNSTAGSSSKDTLALEN